MGNAFNSNIVNVFGEKNRKNIVIDPKTIWAGGTYSIVRTFLRNLDDLNEVSPKCKTQKKTQCAIIPIALQLYLAS